LADEVAIQVTVGRALGALGCLGSTATRIGRLVTTGLRLVKLGLASKAAYDAAQALRTAVNNGDSVGAAKAAIGLAGAVYAMLAGGCFAAGTPILTPDGSKLIEDIRPGDWVITAPDDDPDAEPVPRRVEEIFENYLPLLDLYVNRRTIRTTAEHPFWVRDRGWIAAHQLEAGNELRARDGRWLKVDGLEGPKASETVYNMCVADYHTYFISDQIWEFAVWSHNMGLRCNLKDPAPPADTPAIIRARNIAQGIPASQLGGSGLPRIRKRSFPMRRAAQEAARRRGGGNPINDVNDVGQPAHFHPVDRNGQKLSPTEHFNDPKRQG
jgi:hypothetical protein